MNIDQTHTVFTSLETVKSRIETAQEFINRDAPVKVILERISESIRRLEQIKKYVGNLK